MTPIRVLLPAEFDLIRKTPLFAALSEESIRAFVDEAHIVDYERQTLLFARGDLADRFFIILTGRVRLYLLTSQGRESVIELLETGASFAEAAMFGSGRLPVHGEAAAGTRLLHVPAKPILARIAHDESVVMAMMDSLARWQRHLIGRITQFKTRSPGQRLATALLALAGEGDGQTATVHLPLSKASLAGRIGVTPESFSRAMGRLRQLGMVDGVGSDVTILDRSALQKYAESARLP